MVGSQRQGQRRSFFGPIPEQVLTRLQQHNRRYGIADGAASSTEDHGYGDHPAGLIERHAFTFFLSEGGRPEDWNEEARISIRRKLVDRWLETEWGKAFQRRQDHKIGPDRWVGDSFEIGVFLGLNILTTPRHSAPSRLSLNASQPIHADDIQPETESVSSASGISLQPELPTAGPSKPPTFDAGEPNGRRKTSMVATTPRMLVDASVRVTQHALGSFYGNSIDGTDNTTDVSVVASPAHLLAEPNTEKHMLRDRMLVHVYYSDISYSSQIFNEEIHRTSRNLQYESCGEFLVVWRRDRIEIYKDYTFPIQEWISGHKALAFSIPLSSTTARLSLYSFVDLTFSITCCQDNRPTGLPLTLLSREGSRFFVFKLKSRSRAYDWIWKLWLRLGGYIPKTIEVKNPALNATVSIDVPHTDDYDYDKVLDTFSRQNVIDLGVMGLSTLPDWNSLIHLALLHGKKLELAWRAGTNLDWIWLETDVDEKVRKWAVLCGLVVKESTKGAVLELRLAEHFPDHIYLKNGDRINEPPGVEGYLKRIHPNSSTKHLTYLSTHDGNLFVLRTDRAYPPIPPGLFPHSVPSESSAKEAEIRRGAMQIMHASGVCDLRKILAVRRAFQSVPSHAHREHGQRHNDNAPPRNEELSADDDEDRGERVDDDSDRQMRIRRTFELLLENGNVIRFQAHSYRVAREWINGLRALVSYWKERHRSDAEHEMNLAQAGRPRLTPLMPKCQEHVPVSLPDALPTLVTMYTSSNWCMIEGCRPIIRGGKLFMKKGLRGQYRLIQMFLVTNHLVRYRLRPKSLLHSAMKKKVCLDDAYVCSGYLAAIALPDGEFNPCNPAVGRRYQDGLETNDREEDTMFMVYYLSPDKSTTDSLYHTNTSGIPPISAKRKTLFFRTRSKLERDSWCWAINCEIERTVRMQRNRENVIRNSGNLIP
ncbi:hypothetical protein APHAL10511_002578 [Amanita phalloides]|nr:hypothetical protein APHAL10511_002578 [Amanita phalloides]